MGLQRPFATLIAAVLTCGAVAATSGDSAGPASAELKKEVTFETIEQRSVPGQSGSEVREGLNDPAAWQKVWDNLSDGSGMDEQAPAVDFKSEMVIAAAMPTQGCVSRVTIRGIRTTDEGLVVDLLEQPPAEGVVCVVSERPFHAVRLARHEGSVRWEVEQQPLDPGQG
jgi:hypothetical protein